MLYKELSIYDFSVIFQWNLDSVVVSWNWHNLSRHGNRTWIIHKEEIIFYTCGYVISYLLHYGRGINRQIKVMIKTYQYTSFCYFESYVHSNHLFTYDISCDIYGYIDTQGKDNNDTHEYVMDNIST